jgi:hypothetical protein
MVSGEVSALWTPGGVGINQKPLFLTIGSWASFHFVSRWFLVKLVPFGLLGALVLTKNHYF